MNERVENDDAAQRLFRHLLRRRNSCPARSACAASPVELLEFHHGAGGVGHHPFGLRGAAPNIMAKAQNHFMPRAFVTLASTTMAVRKADISQVPHPRAPT